METAINYQDLVEHYARLLQQMSPELRLDLISRLSQSLKRKPAEKQENVDDLYGSWQSEETAEELIELIRNGRTPSPNRASL